MLLFPDVLANCHMDYGIEAKIIVNCIGSRRITGRDAPLKRLPDCYGWNPEDGAGLGCWGKVDPESTKIIQKHLKHAGCQANHFCSGIADARPGKIRACVSNRKLLDKPNDSCYLLK
jgi:hypothetical protein